MLPPLQYQNVQTLPQPSRLVPPSTLNKTPSFYRALQTFKNKINLQSITRNLEMESNAL